MLATRQRFSVSIQNKHFHLFNVPGDGNCFFHCLSLFIAGNFSKTKLLRKNICGHIYNNWTEWEERVKLVHGNEMNRVRYFENMLNGNCWAHACEIEASAELLKTTINVWLATGFGNHVLTKYTSQTNCQSVNLLLQNGHFMALFASVKNNISCSHENRTHIHDQTYFCKPNVVQQPQSNSDCGAKRKINSNVVQQPQSNSDCGAKRKINSIVVQQPQSNSDCGAKRKINSVQLGLDDHKINLPSNRSRVRSNKLCKLTNDALIDISGKLGIWSVDSFDNEKVDISTRKINNWIQQKQKKIRIDLNDIPAAAPLTTDSQFNKAVTCIRAFELEQMSYIFQTCQICNETRLCEEAYINSTCRRCLLDKHDIKMFSTENNMDLRILPEHLRGLTLVEQQLISRIYPCMNVHMLKHGGIGSSGHCVTFPQEVNEPAQIFPRLPGEIHVLKIRKKGSGDSFKDLRVRRYKVEKALFWLKEKKPAYKDITISKARLESLPEDGEISNLPSADIDAKTPIVQDKGPAPCQIEVDAGDGYSSSGVLLPDISTSLKEKVEEIVHEVLDENATVEQNIRGTFTIPWPSQGNLPLSEFTTRYFFTMAFPCLFPYADADFHINRKLTCNSLSDWAEHLLWYKDGRFAKHHYFKFVVHNMILRKQALEKGSYIIQQQLGEPHLTVQDLKERIESGDNSISDKIRYFSKTLRGTSQYWEARNKELHALNQYQINEGNGLPSFFTTGNCAEFHFKPLRRLLNLYHTHTTGTALDLNDHPKLFKALQENTHIVAKYFDLRTQSYFHNVMGPVFGVNTYWYRQEFAKSRGMVHWHGLCWRKDKEPHKLLHQLVEDGLSESECATKLAEWARHEFRLSANNPAGFDENRCPRKNLWPPPEGTAPKPPEDTNPLTKLLLDVSESQDTVLEDYLLLTNRFNIHRCSDYCLQQSKHNPSIKQCRMEFGTHSNPGKELRDTPAIVKDKNSSLRLEMPRDHPMLVQHSQYHTQAWRANGDISIILSKSGTENPSVNDIIATERYITGYACKGNQVSESMSELVSNVVDMSDDSLCYSGKNICQKFLMNSVKRDISAVEASFEISRLPLYRCSHTFQNISLSGFGVLEKDGSTLTKSTPLDKYLQRNKDDNSSFYSFICSKGKVPVLSGLARPTWPLHEQYCKYMLFLHYPNWRKINDIIPEGKTWTQQFKEFLNNEKCPNFVKAQAESAKLKQPENDLAGDDICERLSSSQEPDWMNILKPNPNYATEDIAFDDGGDTFDWGEMAYQYPHDLGKSFLSKLEDIDKDTAINIPACDLKTMNSDQLFSFNLVMKTVTDFSNNLSSFKPLRLVVSSTAGSGKSYLIKCLVAAIKLHFNSNSAVQVVCPTGNSANVIQGVTLHSFLKIPTYGKHKEMSAPQGNTGLSLQSQLKGLKVLLVDERSMIGANTLGWMEFMCRHGVEDGKNSCLSWGGLPVVVFFGDDVQLPPVLDSPVYSCKSKNPAALHGVMAWKEFEESVHLNTIVRQNESEKTFKDVLSSVRQNSVSQDQAIWLQKFQWDNLTSKYGKQLMKHMTDLGLFVFPTHREVFEHNRAKVIELNKTYPVARIQCVSKGCHAANVSRDKASGLPGNLFICKNAKVMLTVNLNVQYGLFNGAMGTVVDIIYHSNPKPDAGIFPDVIMVHFPSYSGPAFIEEEPKLVPIIAVERKIDCPCHYCKRKQIPLILGWGTTIHKCQGMTIGKGEVNRYIVIQPGTTTFESRSPGALFVALSRAKATGDKDQLPDFAWHQSVFLNEDRVCNKIRSNMKSLRDSEMLRLQKLSEATRSRYINLQQDKAFLNHYDTLFYQHLASEE